MRSRLDEVYSCETGFIARDQNLRNPQFGIEGYVGGLALRRVIVDNYPTVIIDQLLKVMTGSEKRIERVFKDGNRLVVSDGRVLKSDVSTSELDMALKERGFVADQIRIIDGRYGTDLAERLECDARRHVAIVAPNLKNRMKLKVGLSYGPTAKLEVNGLGASIAHLDRVVNGLAKRVKDNFDRLPITMRRPFKADEVVLQQLYDSIAYKGNEEGTEEDDSATLQPSGFWPLSRFIEAVLLQVSWRGLDRG